MTSLRARKLLAAHRRIACCCSRLASNAPPKELKFSETAAYEGYDRQLRRGEMTIEAQPWKPTYYDTRRYQNSKLLSAIFSVIAVFVYFGLIRLERYPNVFHSCNLVSRAISTTSSTRHPTN